MISIRICYCFVQVIAGDVVERRTQYSSNSEHIVDNIWSCAWNREGSFATQAWPKVAEVARACARELQLRLL